MSRFKIVVGVMLLVVATASFAAADTLDFFLTNGSETLEFQLESSPSVDDFSLGSYFHINFVPYVYNGVPQPFMDARFYTVGVIALHHSVVTKIGPQLFTGPTSSPTFTLGVFSLADFGSSGFLGPATLTISNPNTNGTAPVPEPASLILLGSGIAAIAAKRRKRLKV